MVFDTLPYGSELYAAVLILLAVIIGKAFTVVLGRWVHRLTKRTESTLDDMMLKAVQRPIFVGIILGGVFFALPSITLLAGFTEDIALGFSVVWTLFGLWFAIRVTNGLVEWYATEVAAKTKSEKDDQFLPIIKKVIMAVFGFIALLMVLGSFGIEITTLIAALGIGGLAVALALQPTLSNFFSGAHIIADRPVRIGDFIELDSGEKGTVADIGWRSTKLKVFGDNMVIIPNSKLAEATITNYYYPAKPYTFMVDVGVGYGEDLARVEKVTIEEAKKVLKKLGTGAKNDPVVRFKEFGDSNVNFSVYFKVLKYANKFPLRHEFIKALKARFDKERIEIAWPTSKVFFGDPLTIKKKR